ncbi:chemotaxis protein CheY [Synechococcus sp. 63AY4M2]|uniref:response regulator n=1 Tax=unclassified Synechococcus TaxID=2626047 RepID=UPI00006948CB|nr:MULTISPECIES: response regulator [unclassified Synechococcus]ABD00842.1 response regulator [Synechococcus sp. JA-3-3Ab]PIK86376.1 chemotaxis protein CheY [Synechococcus sp. 63AY4M2]PIK89614.1 chemotaxis protein CheY [Synechococcus sp. 65AY6A5]PIK91737.1 chemotaxis protein CheY [Synechococcus sp. 65AY6Li]PIK95440.1 chemotaxis protein CheY [Synechococcus sp. 60AY4M2]
MSKVLVVDDNRTYLEAISSLLSESGLEVSTAMDGVEAMDIIRQQKPDVVVLDIVMPGMNGYEVCREVKKDESTKHIRIVVCSTKDQVFDIEWAKRNQADAYVTKPFKPQELLATIKQQLREIKETSQK